MKEGLEMQLLFQVMDKLRSENHSSEQVRLEHTTDIAGGMMLYTSGTTNRPVSHARLNWAGLLSRDSCRKAFYSRYRLSPLRHTLFYRPGNTALWIIFSMFFLYTIFMVQSMLY